MSDEIVVRTVQATRKGRGRRPCEITVAVSDDGFVVLRTTDESGVSPIVALVKPEHATELCEGLLKAAHALREASPSGTSSVARKRSVSG